MRGDTAKQLRLFQELDRPMSPIEPANCIERQRVEEKFALLMREELKLGQLVSYVGNKTIPVLRLYRYKEAFAFRFVKEFIDRFGLTGEDYLFDPFCGMGTTLFTAMQCDVPAIGIDRLPIATFVAQTLPLFFSIEPQALRETFETLKAKVAEAEPAQVAMDVRIMGVAFPEETLLALRRWKEVIDTLSSPMRDVATHLARLGFAIQAHSGYGRDSVGTVSPSWNLAVIRQRMGNFYG